MENRKKAETFIGFAIKSGKCKIGGNAIATLKKAELIVVCKTASDNTKKDGVSFAKRFRCPVLFTEEKTLEELTFKGNAKLMAITDKALSKAIIENKETVLTEGI